MGTYKCMDAKGEWEWGNWNEGGDGLSIDKSALTSVITDGIFGTSASIDVRDVISTSYSSPSMATPEVL